MQQITRFLRIHSRHCFDGMRRGLYSGKVVDEKSRVVNQLISCLKEFYPKALELFSLNSQIFIAFLKTFPDPDTLPAWKRKIWRVSSLRKAGLVEVYKNSLI